MTSPTTDPLPRYRAAAPADAPPRGDARLAGLALMAGCVLATIGFLAVTVVMLRTPDAPYTDPLWIPLYGVALAGNILVVLGLPAILAVHGHASRRLTLVGYVGVCAPMVMLNVAETTLEAYVKPYLAHHGGVPAQTPAGLDAFELVALLLLVVGCCCLAAAVFRGRILPRWVGVALIAAVVGAFVLHGGGLVFVADYCMFSALFRFGLGAARPAGR